MEDDRQLSQFAQDYFKLLNDGDVATAQRLFHPSCALQHVVDGKISHITWADYIEILRKRESPLQRGEPVYGRVLSISRPTSTMALLEVLSAVQPRYFHDYLTLLREGGRWKIVAKVYHVLPGMRPD